MAVDALTLFVDSNFFSPYAMAVFVALEEKKLDYQLQGVDLAKRENHQDEYRNISLTCRVPTLSDGAFHLSESSAIIEYLEERYPPPSFSSLYPLDLKKKARLRQIQAWLRSDFNEIRQERSTELIFRPHKKAKPLSVAAQKSKQRLLTAINTILPSGAVNLFENWSIVDTELALMILRLVAGEDKVPENLKQYARQQWQRPAVRKWVELSKI